jgi:hypothetical protein
VQKRSTMLHATNLSVLAYAEFRLGDRARAEELFRTSLRMARHASATWTLATILRVGAAISAAKGRPHTTARLARAALATSPAETRPGATIAVRVWPLLAAGDFDGAYTELTRDVGPDVPLFEYVTLSHALWAGTGRDEHRQLARRYVDVFLSELPEGLRETTKQRCPEVAAHFRARRSD